MRKSSKLIILNGDKVLNPKLVYAEYVKAIDTEGSFYLVTEYEEGYEKMPENDVTVGEEIWLDFDEALEKLSFEICTKAVRKAIR